MSIATEGRAIQTGNLHDIEVHPLNHCCRGKAINITHSECVFVALGIQHAMTMRHIVMCELSVSIKFLHII
jgi:hypothetical protein